MPDVTCYTDGGGKAAAAVIQNRIAPVSKIHSDGDLKPFDILAKEAIGVVIFRI